jgi:thioredoxin reductase
MHDVIVVGGGPAGLSAALLLGRCNRRVLVCDSGEYRNARSRGVHGFLSRDGTPPAELLRTAREQLAPYAVELLQASVTRAAREGQGFELTLADGRRVACRKLLLATGVVDVMPELPGAADLWGRGVYACPYCDAWEHRGAPLAAYGRDSAELALSLRTWSEDVTLLTAGEPLAGDAEELRDAGVSVETAAVRRLDGDDDGLRRVVLADGRALACRALFLKQGRHQRSDLAEQLGVPIAPDSGGVTKGASESTSIRGLYVAGDASCERLFALAAAAEGLSAALAIHHELSLEERQRKRQR